MASLSRPRRSRMPSLVEIEHSLSRHLSADAERRSRRLARRRAIARFARTHPLWHDALFEPISVRSLPDDYFRRSPASIARSWAAQFPYLRDVSLERDAARLEPVAREFLEMLGEEEARLGITAG